MLRCCGSAILLLLVISAERINGNPTIGRCGKPADVVFVIDTSSSIWPKDFNQYALPFMQNVVRMFDVGPGDSQTRVGAVTFSTDVRLEFNLDSHQNKDDLLDAISRIKVRGGNTYTDKALKYVAEKMFDEKVGSRADVAHIVVILTDGKSSNSERTIIEARNARENGAAIFAIGVGKAEEAELVQIASQPSSQFSFKVSDYSALDGIKIELAMKACEVNIPATSTVITTTTTTTTAPTTPAPPSNECGGKPAEIFFILDSSSSIWRTDFDKRVIGFVRDIVSNFDIGQDLTRVGVITFSDTPRLVIALDSHSTKQTLLDALTPRTVKYVLGGTNTAEALRDARTIGFHETITREGVAKIAVVITDGQSWNEEKTIKEAELLKKSGVKVYSIGVGQGVKQEELEAIASKPTEGHVFSVNDFGALSELRNVLSVEACDDDVSNDQPVCGRGPTDITFAFDANTLTVKGKHQILDQLHSVTKRTATLGGDVRFEITSGPCPPSMDFSLSSANVASHATRRLKRDIRSNLVGIIKQWRYKTVGDLKQTSAEEDLTKDDLDLTFSDSNKGLVILLKNENVSEFSHIAEEVSLLTDSGVKVMVVTDKSVQKRDVDKWTKIVGHRQVLSGVDLSKDNSGFIMEFICSM